MRRSVLAVGVALALVGCAKKKVDAPPPVGWYGEEGWAGQCYFPKSYDDLGPGDRRLARAAALEEMMTQWSGGRDDGVRFDEDATTYLETVLLGKPELTEQVSIQNAAFCRKYMSALPEERSVSAWRGWFMGLGDKLTEGDCPHAPLVDTIFQYMDVDRGWQFKYGVCREDVVTVKGSAQDKYRLSKDGPWVDVNGNGEDATTTAYACNFHGCKVGQLIMRFTSVTGVQTVVPIGESHTWTAPEHGWIEVEVNDDDFSGNSFREAHGVIDHTSISYVGGGG